MTEVQKDPDVMMEDLSVSGKKTMTLNRNALNMLWVRTGWVQSFVSQCETNYLSQTSTTGVLVVG